MWNRFYRSMFRQFSHILICMDFKWLEECIFTWFKLFYVYCDPSHCPRNLMSCCQVEIANNNNSKVSRTLCAYGTRDLCMFKMKIIWWCAKQNCRHWCISDKMSDVEMMTNKMDVERMSLLHILHHCIDFLWICFSLLYLAKNNHVFILFILFFLFVNTWKLCSMHENRYVKHRCRFVFCNVTFMLCY